MNRHSDRWLVYHELTRHQPPRPHVRQAIKEVDPDLPKTAIDIGCGGGRDAIFLVNQGYEVTAFDAEPAVIASLRQRVQGTLSLKTVVARFETFEYFPVSLVNASSSLFFCEDEHFDGVWADIRASVQPGGVFCGQLLGKTDSWTTEAHFSGRVFEKECLATLFEGFEILALNERNEPGCTALNKLKHWHYWTVIARKRCTEAAC